MYERFINQADPSKKLVYVDPSPYLVETIINDKRIVRSNVAFVFSNKLLISVYSRTESMKGYSIFQLKELPQYKDAYVRILYFAQQKDQNIIKSEIEEIINRLSDAASVFVYTMIPSSMLDPKASYESLRRWMLETYCLRMITQFDARALKSSGYKKWCVAVFSADNRLSVGTSNPWKGNEVFLQRCVLHNEEVTDNRRKGANNQVNEEIILRDLPAKKVSCEELYKNTRTVYKLYSASSSSAGKRNSSHDYKIAEEIIVKISGDNSEKEPIRPIIIYHGYLDIVKFQKSKGYDKKDKENKKKINQEFRTEKKNLKYVCRNCRYPSKESMLQSIESDVVDNENLNSKVRISLHNQYEGRPISCKAAWISAQHNLKGKSGYDEAFCKRIFARPNSSGDMICRLSVGEPSKDTISHAVEWAVAEFELTEAEEVLLWRQLHLIFAYSVSENLSEINPISEIVQMIDSQEREDRFFKSAMYIKSLTRKQECAFVRDQYQIGENLGYRIGALIRLFSAISTGELCALVWDDYRKIEDYPCTVFAITKYFYDKSTNVIPHTNVKKIRQHPIATKICEIIDEWKEKSESQLRNYGIDPKQFGKYPIIHPDNEPTKAITPDNFRNYLNKVLIKYGPEDLILYLSNNKSRKDAYNVAKYGGDFLRENFRYQAYTAAHLDEGETNYLLGINQSKTLENNYVGFLKPTHLLAMRDKIDSWFFSRMPVYLNVENWPKRFSIINRTKRTIEFKPTNFPSEMEVKVKITKEIDRIPYSVFNRLGCDIYIEIIKEDE